MFETGTYIICGQHGVCRVEDMGPLKLTEASKDIVYYTCHRDIPRAVLSMYRDSDKIIMRLVISREEAEKLIDEMEEMDVLWVENEKRREDVFKQALRTCDNREWVRSLRLCMPEDSPVLHRGRK
ncbi:MAG: CarD family transcriptional regulator [Lachnoclostridium sp.]